MKRVYFLTVLIALLVTISVNNSYSYSNSKPINKNPGKGAKILYISDLIKLSPKEFSELISKRMDMWNKLSFAIVKLRMKHHLKKGKDVTVNNYIFSQGPVKRVLFWIILGLLASIFLFILIFGLAPR
jgi:hypothetical protein